MNADIHKGWKTMSFFFLVCKCKLINYTSKDIFYNVYKNVCLMLMLYNLEN